MDKEHFILLSIFSPATKIVTCFIEVRSLMQFSIFHGSTFYLKDYKPLHYSISSNMFLTSDLSTHNF